ncbi:hypothetical protein ACN2XU_24190 [Primorskyibacter sp. 2E107]
MWPQGNRRRLARAAGALALALVAIEFLAAESPEHFSHPLDGPACGLDERVIDETDIPSGRFHLLSELFELVEGADEHPGLAFDFSLALSEFRLALGPLSVFLGYALGPGDLLLAAELGSVFLRLAEPVEVLALLALAAFLCNRCADHTLTR